MGITSLDSLLQPPSRVSSTSGDKSSRLYALHRFVDVYPSITKPERHVRFNDKMWTTTFVLIIYFAMTNVMLFGLSGQALDLFSGFRSIMAGASGTIMHLGIGPIVTGSIIMQLFAGAKIIRLDLTNSEDKAMYQGVSETLRSHHDSHRVHSPNLRVPRPQRVPHRRLRPGLGQLRHRGSTLCRFLPRVPAGRIGQQVGHWFRYFALHRRPVWLNPPSWERSRRWPTTSGMPYSIQNPPSGTLPMIFYMFRESTNYEMIQ